MVLLGTRLALNRAVVLRYRLQLESAPMASATINVRLAAVRRLAYEAADSGLLSPDLVAGIRRVRGVKQLGHRVGNWLTPSEGQSLLDAADGQILRCRRDAAMLALLLRCGQRRSELVALDFAHFQQREEHWAIVDLVGKGGHVRTVPVSGILVCASTTATATRRPSRARAGLAYSPPPPTDPSLLPFRLNQASCLFGDEPLA